MQETDRHTDGNLCHNKQNRFQQQQQQQDQQSTMVSKDAELSYMWTLSEMTSLSTFKTK